MFELVMNYSLQQHLNYGYDENTSKIFGIIAGVYNRSALWSVPSECVTLVLPNISLFVRALMDLQNINPYI